MVGSTGTLLTMRLVRSKLRKREESSLASPATIEAQQTNFGPNSRTNSAGSNCSNSNQHQQHHHQSQIFTTSAALVEGNNATNLALNNNLSNHQNSNHLNNNNNNEEQQQQQHVTFTRTSGIGSNNVVVSNGWVFPPKAPTPNIYNCSNNFVSFTLIFHYFYFIKIEKAI